MQLLKIIAILITASFSSAALSEIQYVRWTGSEDADASLDHVLSVLSSKTGATFVSENFRINETKYLAFTKFEHYPQVQAGLDVEGASLRIWMDKYTGKAVQVEAFVEIPSQVAKNLSQFYSRAQKIAGFQPTLSKTPLDNFSAIKVAFAAIRKHSDSRISGRSVHFVIRNSSVVAVVRLRAARGEHTVVIDSLSKKVLSSVYAQFPTAELPPIDLDLYPIYEEFDGAIQPREKAQIGDLLPTVRISSQDPFSPMRDMKYLFSFDNEALAATPEGRAQGYWSMNTLLARRDQLAAAVPELPNTFESQGVRLAGKYCQVMIHPNAMAQFHNLDFTPMYSANSAFDWLNVTLPNGDADTEIQVVSTFYGRPMKSVADAQARPATRHPQHDPQTYLMEGFDELQVYYSVNTFFKALQARGFSDPELSTRPFTAYLFNPDIQMRDNAYYTNDTINFTTYSPNEGNMARDNLIIWHELGHGLMDRLMDDGTGRWLHLADTGGLSEGMADFVADMILYSVKGGDDFPGRNQRRIVNGTGFLLTNEVHDDGEAYGGVMHDIMERAFQTWGAAGVHKMVDLTLETMRLTRLHPRLTAADFFDHMEFADSLGRANVRSAGEFSTLIREALASRNFERKESDAANFSIKYNGVEVSKGAPGARGREIVAALPEDGAAQFKIDLQLTSGKGFQWTYPVTIKAFKSKRGALQGAVHWTGEENEAESYVVHSDADVVSVDLEAKGKCDAFNRPENSCSDYVYFLAFDGKTQGDVPTAKKRFYVKVKPAAK